jgi:hypothetical protein
MSDTPRTNKERKRHKRSKTCPNDPVSADFARELERELNESIKAIRDADLALRKCLNYLLVQPIFTRNNSDIERESETMESVHLALAELRPFITP